MYENEIKEKPESLLQAVVNIVFHAILRHTGVRGRFWTSSLSSRVLFLPPPGDPYFAFMAAIAWIEVKGCLSCLNLLMTQLLRHCWKVEDQIQTCLTHDHWSITLESWRKYYLHIQMNLNLWGMDTSSARYWILHDTPQSVDTCNLVNYISQLIVKTKHQNILPNKVMA